jgi:hypothetical protein
MVTLQCLENLSRVELVDAVGDGAEANLRLVIADAQRRLSGELGTISATTSSRRRHESEETAGEQGDYRAERHAIGRRHIVHVSRKKAHRRQRGGET